MSISIVRRLFAFFDNVWSFILTLVRSLLALFSLRRRSSDPLALPRVGRPPKEALARAHTRLRPILLTPRSIALSPSHYPHRAQSTRSRSATSTLVPAPDKIPSASGSGPPSSGPQRTSPKLDPHDAELGLSGASSVARPPGSTNSPEGTLDSSAQTTSLSLLPLTPPDRCYLAPVPAIMDCPYTERWPTNVAGKPRPPASPLKVSINVDSMPSQSMIGPIGSPPPGRWSPLRIRTSTPHKSDNVIPDPNLNSSDHHAPQSTTDPSFALANVSHALISRSRSSMYPYDDASNSSMSSNASSYLDRADGPGPGALRQPDSLCERHLTRGQVARSKNQLHPQFHRSYAHGCAWRRHGARVPGKPNRITYKHSYPRSYSQVDLPPKEWYDVGAYVPSPISALSPPRRATEDDGDDEVPLSFLRDRLTRRGPVGATNRPGVPLGMGVRMTVMSPGLRRMSEGCLLAISQSTPTPVNRGARSSRNVVSFMFDGDENDSKDLLEALSLRFSLQENEVPVPAQELRGSVL